MPVGGIKPLGEILVERGLIGKDELADALEQQKTKGELLGQVLVKMGLVSQDDILGALRAQSGMEAVDLAHFEPEQEAVDYVSGSIARIYSVFPLRLEGHRLEIAMSDPMDIQTLDDLRFMLNCELQGVVASEDEIARAIDKYYGKDTDSIDSLFHQIEDEMGRDVTMEERGEDEAESGQAIDIDELRELAERVPVIKLLNLILIQAIRDRASDIHFEPFEDQFKIRYRVDGVLYEMVPPPRHLAIAITSRIKVMSNLDIAERRLPQDGRIQLNMKGKGIDMRVSTLPTVFGESVVMRVLDKSVVMLEMEHLGVSKADLEIFEGLIKKPNGIILTTGPTGCGKTTTLYSCLRRLNNVDVKIITTEDPVEYDISGIIQVQIREAIGLTFASCMRSILRQDPDIILVGEIRDKETGDMAVQASLTGHLVFSTLHTNDAPGAITRLIDMDVEPFLITSTLQAIVAQRLVRTICQNCREEHEPTEDELSNVGLKADEVKDRTFYRGSGCDMCRNIGYLGRIGIYEILVPNEEIAALIVQRASTHAIREAARKAGMRFMLEDGLEKVYSGVTSIEEVGKAVMVRGE